MMVLLGGVQKRIEKHCESLKKARVENWGGPIFNFSKLGGSNFESVH